MRNVKTIRVDFNDLGSEEDGVLWSLQKFANRPVLVGDMVLAIEGDDEFSCMATVIALGSRDLVKLAVDPAVWSPAVA